MSKNNHFICWRYKNQNIYSNNTKSEKQNLLLAVSDNKFIYFEINKHGTNQNIFLKFLEGLLNAIKNEENKNFILVLDNLSAHKTPAITSFFIDNNIKVVYNVPYMSEFNIVELAFRHLKKIIYSKIYENIEMVKNEIEQILTNETINKTLIKNFCETLSTYIAYSNNYQNVNLNNLNYSY